MKFRTLIIILYTRVNQILNMAFIISPQIQNLNNNSNTWIIIYNKTLI